MAQAINTARFWEIDFLRGAAIVLMVAFHAAYDLRFFRGAGADLGPLFWFVLPRLIAGTFILLSGLSLTLSYSSAINASHGRSLFPKCLRRGLCIFSWGLCITAVTWAFLPSGFVVFGILHLIGLSAILGYPFLRRRALGLFLGAVLIAIGLIIQGIRLDFPYLLWLGFAPGGFYTVDYFPLLPWFGVFLIGIFLGNTFYPAHERNINVPGQPENALAQTIGLLGRNSLFIYLVHQPVLIGLMHLSGVL